MVGYLHDRKFIHATALLVGTMVGVGIFGIPFAFAKAGFFVGLGWLILLAAITCGYDLIFAELTLRTQGTHQIAGYASIWLGPWARRLTFFALVLSGYGTLLVYMIIAGQFLHTILSQFISINPDLYSILFALIWSLVVMMRLKTVAAIDLIIAGMCAATVALIVGFGAPHIQWSHFTGITPHFWFLPYGIILFALSGANAIPLQRQLLEGRERLLRPAIITAVTLVSLLYLVFAFAVVGVSGEVTTPEAISGLYGILGGTIIFIGSLFGVMTISTSFLMMGTTLYETFHIDYRARPVLAWLLVIVPPLLFFFSGLRNFIDIMGLIGGVAVGILSVVILMAYRRAKKFALRTPEFSLHLSPFMTWTLVGLFIAGIGYSLIFS